MNPRVSKYTSPRASIAKETPVMVPVQPLRRANKTYIANQNKRLAILKPDNFVKAVEDGGPIDPSDPTDEKFFV